ncbi:unnamed protein product [Rangifer tarandus platyrhynchus]|uniref:Uncharacterized protein n=2 Tax=Rangifer tarandus platyrhynchus TaxID=3082113 RepID=A0ABN8ZTE4_RANTA|nr:unnamed protein product [Rangifer tarandus platyrhynchus]CAI9711098.1 unnamed protein product [Rangifer tarandus platyrhynchus]
MNLAGGQRAPRRRCLTQSLRGGVRGPAARGGGEGGAESHGLEVRPGRPEPGWASRGGGAGEVGGDGERSRHWLRVLVMQIRARERGRGRGMREAAESPSGSARVCVKGSRRMDVLRRPRRGPRRPGEARVEAGTGGLRRGQAGGRRRPAAREAPQGPGRGPAGGSAVHRSAAKAPQRPEAPRGPRRWSVF